MSQIIVKKQQLKINLLVDKKIKSCSENDLTHFYTFLKKHLTQFDTDLK